MLGLSAGWIAYEVIKRIDESNIEILVTVTLVVTAATGASLAAGVDSSDTPTTVPVVGYFDVEEAIDRVRNGDIKSVWPDARIEGLVGTPETPLFNRRGDRIITKIKVRDFQ